MLALAIVCLAPHVRADEASDARRDMRIVIGQMDGTAQRLRAMLREARAKHLKTACFDDALSRADVSLRHAREHARDADDAFARGDLSRARSEIAQVRAMREASREASTMADTCAAGKLDFPAPDTTLVRVYVEPRPAK
jgi:hypothetical protein